MAAPTPAGSPAPESDPIADARALVAMAIGLGKRVRTVQHLDQSTDRKAGLYVSTLVRQAARLLQSTASHDVPQIRAGAGSPGGNSVHYVIRHDRLVGPPIATRFLVVGSDARLRCCVAPENGGARVWADYDVGTAPHDLPLRAVLDALSTLIARLESTVTQLEIRQITREAELDADIALSKARIAGLPEQPVRSAGVKREVASEEPVRPWTRHGAAARQRAPETAPVAAPAVESAVTPAVTPEVTPAAPVAAPAVAPPTLAVPSIPAVSSADDIFGAAPVAAAPIAVSPSAAAPAAAAAAATAPAASQTAAPVPADAEQHESASDSAEASSGVRRPFRLSRLNRAI